MESLIARALATVAGTVTTVTATVTGFGGDVPAVPSVPVQIGTGGTRQGHPQAASWQMLILMFVALIVLGTVVLLYVVWQRRKIVERRRLRRMAEAPSVVITAEGAPESTDRDGAPSAEPNPPTPSTAVETPPRAEPTAPGRPSATAYPEPHVRI